MKNHIKTLIAAAALVIGFSASAEAYPYHHGYYGGSSFVVYSGPAYYGPAYYPAYYYPPAYPYPYAPPPAYAPGYAPPQGYTPAPQQPMPPQADNGYCREYHSNTLINGKYQRTYGTACLQPDGSWQLVN